MNVGIEALFTSALGLQPPWAVQDVRLEVAKRRIDFEVACPSANPSLSPRHSTINGINNLAEY